MEWATATGRAGDQEWLALARGVLDALDVVSGADNGARSGTRVDRSDRDTGVKDAVALLHGHVGSVEATVDQLSTLRVILYRSRAEGGLRPAIARQAAIDRAVLALTREELLGLRTAARLDPLTGLGNRRALDADLAAEEARSIRRGGPYAIVVLDLDGLKDVNDALGHSEGDSMLRRMASRMIDRLRQEDRAYRIGGDEFLLVLPETTTAAAEAIVQRLVAEGAPPFSYGISAYPDDPVHGWALIDVADRRLLSTRRRRGRGRGRGGAV